MFAIASTTEYPAMAADEQCTSRASCMPARPAQTMRGMWATANTLLTQTGVSASVSLFVLLITLVVSLFASLMGLTGLISLSGLTGLVVSLVGLIKGLSPGASMGD